MDRIDREIHEMEARDNRIVVIANNVLASTIRPTTRDIFEETVRDHIFNESNEDNYQFFLDSLECACKKGRLPRSLMVWDTLVHSTNSFGSISP